MTSEPVRVVDPITGAEVWVAGGRQSRPNLPQSACPFCPGGLEAPDAYDVRWFANRWPAMPAARCEVVLYTPAHTGSLPELGVEGTRRVVDLWAERTRALGARPDIEYVLVFENRGAEVGATISHPHGQIYAFDEVPPVAARELAADPCPLCAATPGDRLVASAGGWRAWVPEGPRWPYELMVAPGDHVADLPSLDHAERNGLAGVLVDVLARLDRLFRAPMPYMLWVHQQPTTGGHWPAAHVHVEIAPVLRAPGVQRFVAAGELGSGVFFNPLAPTDAAVALRGV